MARSATSPAGGRNLLLGAWERLKSWEGLLLGVLVVIVIINSLQAPAYLSIRNQMNLLQLFIEKLIVALIMTFLIINGEIDLSVCSVMGLAACTFARLYELRVPIEAALLIGLAVGIACGLFNGFWIAYVGLPSLIVTLAGMIGYRGLAYVLLEGRSVGYYPEWLNRLGQQPFIGPFPLVVVIFFVLLVGAIIVLQYSAFGRYVYVIGNSREVARYSGVKVRRVKMALFIVSGLVSALAGLLYAARLGAVRGSTAEGFELDIITMVLMGGVSMYGGIGSLYGVLLSMLVILNIRNGMSLVNLTGHVQTGVIGVLLILSVLVPNLARNIQAILNRRRMSHLAGTLPEAQELP